MPKPTSLEIIQILKNSGHEAYWAGGCVRDMLLGIEPKDFDIVTSAKPDQIEDLLEKTIPVGKEFGVIIAEKNDHHFEVATFRSDSGYSDGRRPDAVEFTNAEEDAKRRDFTINGLFYDPDSDQVIDYIQGQADLDAKLIRFIGDPHERIKEDHLRILRAIRFKNTLDFQFHPDTYNAIIKHADLIKKVSGERIRDELNKMILHENNTKAFNDMEDLGILKAILPELQAMKGVAQPHKYHQEGDVWTHSMDALEALPISATLQQRWATLLHDVGKPPTFKVAERIRFDGHASKSAELAEVILRRLKFPKKDIEKIAWCCEKHMMMVPLVEMNKGRQRHWFLNPHFKDLLMVMYADAMGTTPQDTELYEQILAEYRKCLKEMPKEPDRLLDGTEIMELTGIKPGAQLGQILDDLRHEQLEGNLKTKDQAIEWLRLYKHEKKL